MKIQIDVFIFTSVLEQNKHVKAKSRAEKRLHKSTFKSYLIL